MASKELERSLRGLSKSVGDFIRYWGFRRVHGAIWTQLYLSQNALSCTDLARRLKFSKALISPALSELERYKLIRRVKSTDEKTVLYEADPDVNSVIKQVLKNRERLILRKVQENTEALARLEESKATIRHNRLQELQGMVTAAQMMLELILSEEELFELPSRMEK